MNTRINYIYEAYDVIAEDSSFAPNEAITDYLLEEDLILKDLKPEVTEESEILETE